MFLHSPKLFHVEFLFETFLTEFQKHKVVTKGPASKYTHTQSHIDTHTHPRTHILKDLLTCTFLQLQCSREQQQQQQQIILTLFCYTALDQGKKEVVVSDLGCDAGD